MSSEPQPSRDPTRRGKGGKPKAVRERSAGVLVFRDTPGGREFLLLDYGRHWDYPKGHLEAGEDDQTAALRELREETGLSDGVELMEGFAKEILYHFQSSRKGLVRKEVVFFIGRADGQRVGEVSLSEEHVDYEWLGREAALERLTFDNARGVLAAADNFLRDSGA